MTHYADDETLNEIKRLQDQVAVLTKERNELANALHSFEMLELELVASQAREAKLRETLTAIKNRKTDDPSYTAWEALALPFDDTALQQRLAQERERCAKVCDEMRDATTMSQYATQSECRNIRNVFSNCAAAIRSMK